MGKKRDRASAVGNCCCTWVIAPLLYAGFWLVMVSLPPMSSLAGEDNRYLDDRPTTCSVELVGVRGLQPAAAPGAASPAFDLVLRVDNGHVYSLRHGGGDVLVSYAGVPLARGRTPGFRVPDKEAVTVPVNVTGAGVGLPHDLFRLVTAERRWGVAMLQVDIGIASQSFTCDVLVDGPPSACRLT